MGPTRTPRGTTIRQPFCLRMALTTYRRVSHQLWPRSQAPSANHRRMVGRILAHAGQLANLGDHQLADRMAVLRSAIAAGRLLFEAEIVEECFALTNEAVRRTTSMSFYEVQLLAGLALATGAIAEMKTGEGKTIVAALPATLQALQGRGVHVATVNSYLAERDFELMLPAFQMLGLSAGLLRDQHNPLEKRKAYLCDVTYGTGYEFGFDYLRDQSATRRRGNPPLGQSFRQTLRGMTEDKNQRMQRGHAFAVIDEVDSVLIDEANTPLVLSGPAANAAAMTEGYRQAANLIDHLQPGIHYTLDQRERSIFLTEAGHDAIFQSQSILPPGVMVRPWMMYVEQALRARFLLERDVDYVIKDDQVMIVDQYTGRIFADRTWRDGLHQAVEFKEGVTVTAEKNSLARISRQRYFGLYDGLCGMTGTASGHDAEFQQFYRLPVVIIPERLPSQRQQFPTRYFATTPTKWQAIVDDIQRRYATGQPVLVGTQTIRESDGLAQLLRQRGLPHQVLNGTQTEDEASIIARAGQLQAVVIATNMAGRGTDICLPDEVVALGGLHVVATQRQESRRVDRQLIGRSARQGLPGSFQFFVAADDDLLESHGSRLAEQIRNSADEGGEMAVSFDRELNEIQRTAEQRTYEARCALYRQDRWLNEVLSTVAEIDEPTKEACAG